MLDIHWKPDRNNPTHLHIQIANYIRSRISNGDWPIGFKIPSQRTLSEIFGVNRSTVVTAIEELISSGILSSNYGAGTEVVKNEWIEIPNDYALNWNSYISSSAHQYNHKIMQEINKADFKPNIIRMGSCEPSPDLIPSDMIRRIFGKLAKSETSFGYEEPKGSLGLRKELSSHLKSLGIEAEPSGILITSGVIQALQLISIGLLKKYSVVYLEKPSYLYSLRIFQSYGMQLAGVPLNGDGIDIEELSSRQRSRRGSMLFSIPTFHNPTGHVMSLERRKQLIDLCASERLPIIEDDVYRDLWLDSTPPPPIKAFDKNGLVLYTGGMSKNLSPGLRIGWIVGPEQVINKLADIKMQTDYGTSSLSQSVATELISSGLYEEHNENLRRKVRIRRDIALTALNKYFLDFATWEVPSGGYYIWLKLNKGISMHKLFIKALKHNILIHPGDLYDFHSNQHIRISYSYATHEKIELGIRILAELISSQM